MRLLDILGAKKEPPKYDTERYRNYYYYYDKEDVMDIFERDV
jgi:hypothetical protein